MDKHEIIKLMRYALAVVELDSPGKRGLLRAECAKFDIDSDRLLAFVESEVGEYEYLLSQKGPKGLRKKQLKLSSKFESL